MADARREALLKEAARRGLSQQSAINQSISSKPLDRKQQLQEEAKKRGLIPQSPDTHIEDPSFADRALALGKGLVSGIGGAIPDTAALIYNFPAMIHNMQVNQTKNMTPEQLQQAGLGEYYGAREIPMIPSATEAIERGIESTTGIETPEDIRGLYEGTKFAGSLAGFGGVGKAAGKLGMKGLEKAGAALGSTNPSQLIAAVPTGAVMHDVGEEYGPVGGLLAGAATGTIAQKGLQGLKGQVPWKGQDFTTMTVGRALSKLGKPKEEVEKLLKQNDLEPPFNLRLQSGLANFIGNIGLNTAMRAKEYGKQIENYPQKNLDVVIQKINQIHPENIGSSKATELFGTHTKEERKIFSKDSQELRNILESSLKPDQKTNMPHLVKGILDLQKQFKAPVLDPQRKYVMDKVNRLADALGIIRPPKGSTFTDENFNSTNLFRLIAEKLEKNPELLSDTASMVEQRSSFLKESKYGEHHDVRAMFGKLASDINKDLMATPNQEFVNNLKAYNYHYRTEGANRVRSNLAWALTKEEAPTEAYNYMTTPQKVERLRKIAGDSDKGKQVFNALARAKLQDLVIDKVTDVKGGLNHGAFITLFSKGNENQEMLQSLLGKDIYRDLQKFTDVSKSASKAFSQFANYSGTALAGQDITKAALVGKGLLDVFFTGGTGMLLSGGLAIGGPYVMSKILSNKKYINAAVKYGEAVKNKNLNDARVYDNRMRTLFLEMAKKEAPTSLNKEVKSNERNTENTK